MLDAILREAELQLKVRRSDLLNARDENGWGPLHEAIRGNHLEMVKYLIGMDSKAAQGNTIDFARRFLPSSSMIVAYLEAIQEL